jgi:hypothetical protein
VNDTGQRVERILSTLNAADVGSLESIAEKMLQVEGELLGLGRDELAGRAREAVASLRRGDVAEFQRARAFLQSKVGHLRP